MNKLFNVRLDDKLTALLIDNIGFFRFIHPNVITITGIFLNFYVFYLIINNSMIMASALLVVRYLTDCLDGGVARKYNKKSKIGGALDTWSDTILLYIAIAAIFRINSIPFGSEVAAFFAAGNLYIMSLTESLIDHVGMKTGTSVISNIYAFFVNNSFILFLIYIFLLFAS